MKVTPVLLIILDGFGHREECELQRDLPGAQAALEFPVGTPTRTPSSTPRRNGWGCRPAQMGNSEVGHMNIGAGPRRVPGLHPHRERDRDRRVLREPGARQGRRRPRARRGARCTCSASSRRAACTATSRRYTRCSTWRRAAGVKDVRVHAFLDGRDTPPKSAEASLAALQEKCAKLGAGTHRVDLRPLLRDGPRPALGARGGRPIA